MQKKSQDFSMEEVLRLAKSPAGQQLLAMLQQADTEQVQQVARQAAAGNYAQASQALQALLATEEAQKLVKQLGG